jgi:hypothetical protein
MTAHSSCRLALAMLDQLIGNEPLKGDLIEELHRGRSRWWFWRQVVAAVVRRPMSSRSRDRRNTEMLVLGAAVLILLSFEAVFVVNVVFRLIFGPPPPNVSGYAYLMQYGLPEPTSIELPAVGWFLVPLIGFAAAMPVGSIVARLHRYHYEVSLGFVVVSVMACAVLTLQAPFVIQFLTMLMFVSGLLVGGRHRSSTLPLTI